MKQWASPLGPVFFLFNRRKQQLVGAIGALFFFLNIWGYTSGFDGHEKRQLGDLPAGAGVHGVLLGMMVRLCTVRPVYPTFFFLLLGMRQATACWGP